MANATGFTPQELQHLHTILVALAEKLAMPDYILPLVSGLMQKTASEFERLSATGGIEVGKQYRVDCPGHWSHGKCVTVDKISNGGLTAEFHVEDDTPGYSFLPVGCFSPDENLVGICVGDLYVVDSEGHSLHGLRVVVCKLPRDGGMAIVCPEDDQDDKRAVACSHLKAVQP